MEIRALSVSLQTLAEALLSGQADIGLTYNLGLAATFQREPLLRAAPWVWITPEDDLAARSCVSLAEVADRPLILSNQDLSIQHMLGLFRRNGATPLVRHRAASIELLRSLAANGEGTELSYTNPPGECSYDGKPIARTRIGDQFAEEPIILAYIGTQLSPLPQIRASIQNFVSRACT